MGQELEWSIRHLMETLAGKSILLTGATGFLAKVVLERLLSEAPDVRAIYILVRARDDGSAGERMEYEIFSSPLFSALRRNGDLFRLCAEKVRFVRGDTARQDLGIEPYEYLNLLNEVDLVINSAASTDFMGPLDELLQTNVLAVDHVAAFVERSRKAKLIHVSTCYVNEAGNESKVEQFSEQPEGYPSLPGCNASFFDLQAVIAYLEKRVELIQMKHSKDAAARRKALVDEGLRFAREHGWHNIYTCTKWLAEKALQSRSGGMALAIVRPSIIESCVQSSAPGWIEGFKVADPLIYGTGIGAIRFFPGKAHRILDMIPADFVANAILLASADLLESERSLASPRILQVCSGSENPLTQGQLLRFTKKAFNQPCPRHYFLPYPVFATLLAAHRLLAQICPGMPRLKRNAARVAEFARVYLPYSRLECVYDNRNLRALHAGACKEDQIKFPVSARAIDWEDYLVNVHIPGLLKHAVRPAAERVVTEPAGKLTGLEAAGRFLANEYFRAELIHEFPDESSGQPVRGAIYIGNHSGMGFPWDAYCLMTRLKETATRPLRLSVLAAPILFQHRLTSPFAMPRFWTAPEHLPATTQNFEAALSADRTVLVYPEGIAGIGKGFDRRYQLQRFSTSAIRLALKFDRDLIPVYTVNGEYLNPHCRTFPALDRLARRFGIPFLPIGWTILLALVFPFAIYISLPAKLRYVIGARINPRDLTRKSHDELSRQELEEIAERIRQTMQLELYRHVGRLGEGPYRLGEFLGALPRLGLRSFALLPLAWPWLAHFSSLSRGAPLSELLRSTYLCVALSTPVLGWPLYLLYLLCTGRPEFSAELVSELAHKGQRRPERKVRDPIPIKRAS